MKNDPSEPKSQAGAAGSEVVTGLPLDQGPNLVTMTQI